jgi:hypothetical protein
MASTHLQLDRANRNTKAQKHYQVDCHYGSPLQRISSWLAKCKNMKFSSKRDTYRFVNHEVKCQWQYEAHYM